MSHCVACARYMQAKTGVEWVQCDGCDKWRRVPAGCALPDKWFCHMNRLLHLLTYRLPQTC